MVTEIHGIRSLLNSDLVTPAPVSPGQGMNLQTGPAPAPARLKDALFLIEPWLPSLLDLSTYSFFSLQFPFSSPDASWIHLLLAFQISSQKIFR